MYEDERMKLWLDALMMNARWTRLRFSETSWPRPLLFKHVIVKTEERNLVRILLFSPLIIFFAKSCFETAWPFRIMEKLTLF